METATAWTHRGNPLKFSGSIEVLRAEICSRNSQNKRKKNGSVGCKFWFLCVINVRIRPKFQPERVVEVFLWSTTENEFEEGHTLGDIPLRSSDTKVH